MPSSRLHPAARRLRRGAAGVAVLVAAALALMLTGVWAPLAAALTGDPEHVRATIESLGPLAPAASVGLNVLQAVVAPIPGFVVPYLNGVVFGTWAGMLITWLGGIAAAATCFAIARTFGRGFAERLCRRSATLARANRAMTRNGFAAITAARLLPGMPFDAFSYLGGLTGMRFRTFIAGTAVGSAPHAWLYAALGAHLALPLWVGLLLTPLVGLVVVAVHQAVRRLRGIGPAVEPVLASASA